MLGSDTLFSALRRASRYPKFRDVVQPHRVGRTLNARHGAELIDPGRGEYDLADPRDAWLPALAEAGQAAHVVTGDRRFGPLARGRDWSASILTPAAFCTLLG